MVGWLCNSNVAANVPHAKRTSNGAVHKQSTTAELVDENEEPKERDDGLDDAENSSGQKGGVCASDANGLN